MTAPTPPAPTSGATRARTPLPDPSQASTGELVGTLTEQITTLVRSEVRLAHAEVTRKAKRLGIGAGLFGGAAIVVAVVLFLVAGILALIGKKDVDRATPPLPTETLASVQADIATVKQAASR